MFQHIGNWLHVAEQHTVGEAITIIHRGIVVSDDMKKQFPTLAADTAMVAEDVLQCKALAAAVALVVAGEGLNLAADAGVLSALITDGPALIKLFADAELLLKTVGVDVTKDIHDLEGK